MTPRETLLRNILLDPTDELVRLIYADFLNDYGDERDSWQAGMIRGQWPSVITPIHDYWPELKPLLQDHALFRVKVDGVVVFSNVPSDRSQVHTELTFTRGFLSSLTLPAAVFREHAAMLFSRHPITEVRLSDRQPHDLQTGYHAWFATSIHHNPASVGPKWFHLLKDYDLRLPVEGVMANMIVYYTSEPAAISALSSALVSWGRSEAGLSASTIIS